MEANYNYTCPNCSQECSAGDSLTGQNVLCPHCTHEFFATPPESKAQVIVPERLPFFKAGRRKILDQRMQELVEDGELSSEDDRVLSATAARLGLTEGDLEKIQTEHFFSEFGVIQRRIESVSTD